MNFKKGHWYQFANQQCQHQFESRFRQNQEFGDWIGMNPFMVVEVNALGEAEIVKDQNNETRHINITTTELGCFFKLCDDLHWTEGATYSCIDPKSFLWSVTNERFWAEIGFNNFKVVKTSIDEWTLNQVKEIEYISKSGELKQYKITLNTKERAFFKKHPNGEMTSHKQYGTEIDLHKLSVLAPDEIELLSIGYHIATCEEAKAPVPEIIQPVKLNKSFILVDGDITIRISSEEERLKAIEYLNQLSWG